MGFLKTVSAVDHILVSFHPYHKSFLLQSRAVRALIKGGANISAQDENGVTALLQATIRGHIELVKVPRRSLRGFEMSVRSGAMKTLQA